MTNKVMKITAADFEKVVRNAVNQRMKIAREPNKEDAPYRPGPGDGKPPWPGYPKPYEPKLAAANNIKKTGGPLANDDDYGEGNVPGHPDWKLAHGEGRGPQQKFHDEYNRPLDKPPYRSIYPSGETLDIDWQKEKYMKDHPQFFPEQQANMKDSLQRENVGGTLRDMMLPLLIKEYGKDGSGGYKNPSKLLSGMKKLAKNLPANNIRRLSESGHMTVPDPNGSGRLKIIDSLGPQA